METLQIDVIDGFELQKCFTQFFQRFGVNALRAPTGGGNEKFNRLQRPGGPYGLSPEAVFEITPDMRNFQTCLIVSFPKTVF